MSTAAFEPDGKGGRVGATWRRLKASTERGWALSASASGACVARVKHHSRKLADGVLDNVGTLTAFLADSELLKRSASLTHAAATQYDRALDAEYVRTHVGGALHRLFDGGHDLWGAWVRVRAVAPDDTLLQELAGYSNALWKDVTTSHGLPLVTWDREGYEAFADWIGGIPGVSRTWAYRAVTVDVFDAVSAGLGSVALALALRTDDGARLSERLGSLGTSAVVSANAVLALGVVATAGYAQWRAQTRGDGGAFDVGSVARGAALAGTSAAVFALLGGHVVVKLAIAIAVTAVLRRALVHGSGRSEDSSFSVPNTKEDNGERAREGASSTALNRNIRPPCKRSNADSVRRR